ncbi:MAG: PQQ-binding-like beta-propeller repeat protein [Planctomycetaceae bacterium]|nr:PQQ-binding-like beta-propeller repeat protein [Planctomycetaceae bacterium]
MLSKFFVRVASLLLLMTFILQSLSTKEACAHETLHPSWNQFRGPTANGKSLSQQLPIRWDETKNICWKTAISGKAWSSPVISGNTIWLSNATEDGRRLSLLAIDTKTGHIRKDVIVFEIDDPMFCHPFNSYASPTPVLADGFLWVHYGSAGTACLDLETEQIIWTRQDLPCDHHRGPGSSPIFFDGAIFLTFDGFDQQYLACLDAKTGETIWRTDRSINYGSDNGDFKKAYSTPTIITHNNRTQLISPAAVATVAYDPHNGQELWTVYHGGFNAAARPLYSHGLVILCTAKGDRLLAVRPDGKGDITKQQVVWKFGKSAPPRPSQSVVADQLYMVSDTGIFSCIDIETGDVRWSERHSGRYSASLVSSGQRLYACDEDGGCVVFQANPESFEVISENTLDSGCMASPAVIGNDLIIRTKSHLYRISSPEPFDNKS